MLFNSYEFLFLFLPVTFFIYFLLNKLRFIDMAKSWLVLASLVFYSYWNIKYLPIILVSILFNFSIGVNLNNSDRLKNKISRKALLTFGVAANLILLGYFKYSDFFLKNINSLFATNFNLLHIILPLGISFFTFTQIAYLVDAYKKEVKELDFLNYALFVTFFPHLIAGPILHHSEMMPQFAQIKNKVLNYKNISMGIFLFTVGLAKKVIIADNLSPLVHSGFDLSQSLSFFEAWIVSLAYTFQLYFDFSGYTDMALGLGYMFNIRLPQNFNSPYKAQNIQDFWRRWHMTLSRFLRDYVYIPMGGNRNGELSTHKNLFLTFLLGGLWHGAAWTFIGWGALHGFALVTHRLWKKLNITINKYFATFATFIFINITWVFFRAESFDDALKVLRGMFGLSGFIKPEIYHFALRFQNTISNIDWKLYSFTILIILLCILIVNLFKNSNELTEKFSPSSLKGLIIGLVICILLFNMNRVQEFLYFNF